MSLSSFLCMLSRETLKGGQRGKGTQRTTHFRALCSLPRKWRQASLLPVPRSTSLGLGFYTPKELGLGSSTSWIFSSHVLSGAVRVFVGS
jgi:hypothetical protein